MIDEPKPTSYFDDEPERPRRPKPVLIIGVVLVLIAAIGVAVWQSGGSSQPVLPANGLADPSSGADGQTPSDQNPVTIEEFVTAITLQRDVLSEMVDTPATTIAWAVSQFGFRPADLPAGEPWAPPSPEQVLSLDDPGPIYVAFVRNIQITGTAFSIDDSIDLVLDSDGVTSIGVQYVRFTDAPVDEPDVFIEVPE